MADDDIFSILNQASSQPPPPAAEPAPAQPAASAPARPDPTDALLARWDKMMQGEQSMLAERNKEMGTATTAAIQAGRDQSATGRKALATMQSKLQTPPKAPQQGQQLMQGAWQWMGVAAALAALAGAFSRYHVTTAMTAFSGAVKGFAEGNLQAFDQNMQKWKTESQAVKESNDQAIHEYTLVMQDAKMNLDQKMNEVQLIASKWQDQLMASAAAQKNFTMVAHLLQQRANLSFQHDKWMDQIVMKADDFDLKMTQAGLVRDSDGNIIYDPEKGTLGGWSKEAIHNAAQVYIDTGKWPTQLGTRNTAPLIKGAIADEANRIMQEKGIKPEELSTRWTKYTGEQQYQRTSGGFAARVESAVNELQQAIPLALQSSQNVNRGRFVPFNTLLQQWRLGKSDPATNDFVTKTFSVLTAYTRAMNPSGAPHVNDRLEAHAIGLLNTANSHEAFRAQLQAIWQEAVRSKSAVAKTRAGLQPGDVDEPFPEPRAPAAPGGATGGWSIERAPPRDTFDQRFQGAQ